MKKVMFVLVCLLLVSTAAFALESGPSNKVGYVKFTLPNNSYTSFGLPFVFWDVPTGNVPNYGVESRKPSDIIGVQANCSGGGTADRILDQNTGQFAWRNSTLGCDWTGLLETQGGDPGLMEPAKAYWYWNRSGAQRTLVLAGEADITGAGIPARTITAPASTLGLATPYSWRDPRELATSQLNLVQAGLLGGTGGTSDRVTAQVGGSFAYYNSTTNVWAGTLTTVTPGAAYWIINKHPGHAFNYTYLANGQPITLPEGDPELQSVKTSKVTSSVKTGATAK